MKKLLKLKEKNLEKQKYYLNILEKFIKEEEQDICSYMETNELKEIPKIDDIDDLEFLEKLKSFETHSIEIKYLKKIIELKEKEFRNLLN